MQPYEIAIKEHLKTTGTCRVLEEERISHLSYTADLSHLSDRISFLTVLVDLMNVPYDPTEPFYTDSPTYLLDIGNCALEELSKCFPRTAYVEVKFRKTTVLLSLYETRYIDSQGLLAAFHNHFCINNASPG